MTSDRIAAGLSVAAFLFLVAVVYVGATAPQKPETRIYSLDIEETRATNDQVHARGKTNLPDDAHLHIVIDRLYRIEGRDHWTSARVGETLATVQDEAWEAVIAIDDERWVEEVHHELENFRLDPLEAIHPSLRTTVLFSPVIDQPDRVLKVMGANFESLSQSEEAFQEGDWWVLRREKNVEMPLKAELESKLMPKGALGPARISSQP